MSKICYFTRSHKKGNNEVSIWLRIYHKGYNLRISTGLKIPAKYWSSKRGWVKDVPFEPEVIQDRIKLVETKIYEIKHRLYIFLIENDKINYTSIKRELTNLIKDPRTIKYSAKPTFSQYIYSKICAMENKQFLNKGEPYTMNAIDNWRKFMNVWCSFEVTYKERGIYPDEINMETYYSFMDYCDSNGYKKSTKYQYARVFKAALNYALIDEVSANKVHLNRNFATHTSSEAYKGIYLTADEILRLSALEFPENSTHAKIRDLFLLGCYTGLRFSDYSSINMDDVIHFEVDGSQHSALIITQKKTKQEVAIPLLNDDAETILKRYGGRAPKVSISSFNREIKYICSVAGIREKVKVSEMVGGKIVYKVLTKNQLVSSHTARRSCITNLYLSGKLDSAQIRDISGHKSEQAFQRYLCLSKEENVKTIVKRLVQ